VLGQQSGLCAIDIDTDDPVQMKAIMDQLPTSPWLRKGQKGVMLAYKFSGAPTFRLKDTDGKTLG